MYEIKIIKNNMHKIAEVISAETFLNEVEDILDVMANLYSEHITNMIIYEHNLPEKFFDLKTRFAGEVLQKFSSYHMHLAIIGDFEKFNSDSLHAFIRESNRGNQIFFVTDRVSAIGRLIDST